MGTITRHAGAPFARGETSSAADLEADIAACYEQFNGNIDDTNLDASTQISGATLLDSTLTSGNISTTPSDGITTEKMAKRCYVQTSTTGDSLAEFAVGSYFDVPGIQRIIVTPYSSTDLIFARFSATLFNDPSTSFNKSFAWTFSVDGTDLTALSLKNTPAGVPNTGIRTTISYQWSFVAGLIRPITITPRMACISASVATGWSFATTGVSIQEPVTFEANKIFTAIVLPG